jgi:ATP-binding cassette subfamily B protein
MRALGKVADGLRLGLRLAGTLRVHARGQGGAVGVVVLLSLLLLALRMAQPWPLKWVVDALTTGSAGLPWGLPEGETTLWILAGSFLALSLLAAFSEYGHTLVTAGLVNRVVYAFRERLYRHVLRLPLTFHEKKEVGELLTRVVSDIARLRKGLAGLLLRGFRSVFLFLATAGVLLWIDRVLALVMLGGGLAAGAVMLFRGRLILQAAKKNRKREGKLATIVEENLQGIRELQTYRAEGALDPRFQELNEKSLRTEQKLRRLEAGLLFTVEAVLAGSLCLIVWLGSRSVAAGRLTAGDLVLFITYMLNLYRPFTQFARQASQSGRTLACADRLIGIVEQVPDVADRPGSVAAGPFEGSVEFDGVSVRAPKDRRGSRRNMLAEVSFRLEAGQRLAIVGPNGAGKSTLLRHVVRLADPEAGRVLVDGRDVRDYTVVSLRGQVSVVYQDAALFGLTVRENVTVGRPGASEEEVRRAAERARISELVEGLPEKYETVVRRLGKLFSSGERQRLALARAILRDGRIWLLDEPTTGLDAAASAQLEEALLEASRGRTALWVTHQLPVALGMDRILFLDEGRVKFFGTPEEFGSWVRGAPKDEAFLRSLAGQL